MDYISVQCPTTYFCYLSFVQLIFYCYYAVSMFLKLFIYNFTRGNISLLVLISKEVPNIWVSTRPLGAIVIEDPNNFTHVWDVNVVLIEIIVFPHLRHNPVCGFFLTNKHTDKKKVQLGKKKKKVWISTAGLHNILSLENEKVQWSSKN